MKVVVLVLIIKQVAYASEAEVETDLLVASGNFIPTFTPYGSAFPVDSYNGGGGYGPRFGGIVFFKHLIHLTLHDIV